DPGERNGVDDTDPRRNGRPQLGRQVAQGEGLQAGVSRALLAVCSALLLGCAADVHRAVSPGMASAEVGSLVGKPTASGQLPDGSAYWDYSRQPYYTDRVTFGPDDRVREVPNLLTEQNYEK